MEILEEKTGRISHCRLRSFRKIVPVSQTKFTICWKPQHCKTAAGVEMLKYSWKFSMVVLVDIECIDN